MLRKFSILASFAAVLFVVGCGKEPAEDINSARSAVDSARATDAQTYASEEFNDLEASLNAALAEVNTQNEKFLKNYDKAKGMLASVTENAAQVESIAKESKAAAKSAAEEMRSLAVTAIDNAKAAVGKAPVGKGTRADIELFWSDISDIELSLAEVRMSISNEDFFGASSKAKVIRDRADALVEEINAALEKYPNR